MKTTLDIDDHLMEEVRGEAARQGRTVSDLVGTALRLMLRMESAPKEPTPLPSFHGGGTFVDIAYRNALYEAMECR